MKFILTKLHLVLMSEMKLECEPQKLDYETLKKDIVIIIVIILIEKHINPMIL